MEIPGVCLTWSSTILVVVIHVRPQHTMRPVPTMSAATPARTWSLTLTEPTCMRMKLKATTTSTLPTKWMGITDMTDSGITAATGQMAFPRIPTQRWGRRGAVRGPEMSCWQRTCTRHWWRSIWKAGTTEARATGREGGGCWLDMTLTAALSSAWATRPCQWPSATPAEPPLFPQVRWRPRANK